MSTQHTALSLVLDQQTESTFEDGIKAAVKASKSLSFADIKTAIRDAVLQSDTYLDGEEEDGEMHISVHLYHILYLLIINSLSPPLSPTL